MKPCKCGCGILIKDRNNDGPIYYRPGHHMRGRTIPIETRIKISNSERGVKKTKVRKLSEEEKEKLRQRWLGINNINWKDTQVGYAALHMWIRRHKPKPEFCEICNKKTPEDIANISTSRRNKETYNRNFENWQWLCHRCHSKKDRNLIRPAPPNP